MSINGEPWQHSPLANLSLSDPRCNNDSCKAFYEGHVASQNAVSYNLQFEYGHWTTWYYLAIVGIFAALHVSRIWRRNHGTDGAGERPKKTTALDRARAARRMITYRRLCGPIFDRLGLPSYGMATFLFTTFILFVAATFAVQPYYRQHRGYGSPPIAVRTGLMAVACTPIIVALSGKANIITLLTGIGHEKLNVIHRYVAWMCFFLSVVHTIPFIIAPLNDGGPAALKAQFYKPGGFEYTGVPPLAILFGIVLLSIPWIRHRAYETFWNLHILLGLTYLGLMFWHAGQEQDSWAYLWATLALLFSSVLVRIFHFNRAFDIHGTWLQGSQASIQNQPGEMTRLRLVAPPGFSWRPGQHCYLRLPSLRPWDNHPFTIACAQRPLLAEKRGKSSDLLFIARTRTGFTQALHKVADVNPDATAKVWLDGPYGGIRDYMLPTTDQLILVAGGVGITACLPWLQALSDLMEEGKSRMQNITLLWAVRHKAHIWWIEPELQELMTRTNSERISVSIHVTREKDPAANQQAIEGENQDSGKKSELMESSASNSGWRSQLNVKYGRPFVGNILPELLTYNTSAVIACGPESLKIDASNACASEQKQILKGHSRELKFHSETFGW